MGNKGIFFFPLTLHPIQSTRSWNGSWQEVVIRFALNGMGIKGYPEGLGGKQEWPPGPGCQVTWNKGTWSYWNAFHIQILKLVPGDILFHISKGKKYRRGDSSQILREFHKRNIDLWSRLVCRATDYWGFRTGNNWGISEARGVCLCAFKWPYGGIRTERRLNILIRHCLQMLCENQALGTCNLDEI